MEQITRAVNRPNVNKQNTSSNSVINVKYQLK